MAYTKFRRGSGLYTCQCCKRQTRDINGDAVQCGLCAECFDVAGWDNAVTDDSTSEEYRGQLVAAIRLAIKLRGPHKGCMEGCQAWSKVASQIEEGL